MMLSHSAGKNASACLILNSPIPFRSLQRVSNQKLPPCVNGALTSCPSALIGRYSSSQLNQRFIGSKAVPSAAQPESDAQAKKARGTLSRLKTVSWISFWTQLALSLASAGVLLFTISSTGKAGVSSLFLAVGVAASLISTGLVRVVLSKSRAISKESNPTDGLRKWNVSGLLLRNTDINLVGMGASIIALQGEIGVLVGKTLSSSTINPYTQQQAAPAALDIFTVQGAANVLLAHFCSLFLLTFLLRALETFSNTSAATT